MDIAKAIINVVKEVFRASGDIVQGISGWIGFDNTIRHWVNDGNEEKATELLKTITSDRIKRQQGIDKLQMIVDELQAAGVNMSGNVGQAINRSLKDAQQKLQSNQAANEMINTIEDRITELSSKERTLGEFAAQDNSRQEQIDKLIKEKEDVQKFQEERL